MEADQRPSAVEACVIRVSWRPQLATFNSRLPNTAEGKDKNELDRSQREQVVYCRHSAFGNDLAVLSKVETSGLPLDPRQKVYHFEINLAKTEGAFPV